MPEKVEIPERYVPDSDDEELHLSEGQKLQRREKADKIRKMLAAHR